MSMKFYALAGLLMMAPYSVASLVVGAPLGVEAGQLAGDLVGSVTGTALPLGIGGMAVIAALSLIIGAQLIKRKK